MAAFISIASGVKADEYANNNFTQLSVCRLGESSYSFWLYRQDKDSQNE
jgi:hypothetical protein